MIVAYDLRYATDHFVGIGTHAFWLLDGLLQEPGNESYLVLWNPALPATRFDMGRLLNHPRVRSVKTSARPLDPLSLVTLGRQLSALRPDVYFSPFFLKPLGLQCRSVLTLYDVAPLRLAGQFLVWKRALFRAGVTLALRASLILTSSEFSRGEIERLFPSAAGKVRCLPLGIPPGLDAGEALKPADLGEGEFALVVGINKPHKNLAVLARAWAILGEQPPLRLLWVGPADSRYHDLAELARRAEARAIVALGRRPEQELRWLYRHAALVLVPSRYEGYGFPLVEAFAHGAPVIASDIPPLRELGDGAACFVEPDRPERWAEAVTRLHGDAEERGRMRTAGLAKASRLTYRETARRVVAILRELADKPTG